MGVNELAEQAAAAARNGATVIQYRDKTGTGRQMVDRGRTIRAALLGTGVPLLINDRADVALAIGANGVHLGREDMHPEDARRLLGETAIIGLTVKNAADADFAAMASIDYACVGGVFTTISKHNPEPPVGLNGFAELAMHIKRSKPDMPVGAIAGIDFETAPEVIKAGADGVAVISAIFRAGDPAAATRRMRSIIDQALEERAR
ncbi:MAG TPA: thiamine phosphate synthase [Tianweitania sediminis]|nr:thiamine phosphate synthase [Tianweitania sediminis]